MSPWVWVLATLAAFLLIACGIPMIFSKVWKIFFKEEQPYPFPVAVSTIIGVSFLTVGIVLLAKIETITASN